MVAESKPPLGGSIWILSLFIAILAVLLQRSYGESGPFVAVFVFAAFLAIGLPFRQFSWLLSLLALLLVVPLFFESGNSSDVSQVLIGVACLASIVAKGSTVAITLGGDCLLSLFLFALKAYFNTQCFYIKIIGCSC